MSNAVLKELLTEERRRRKERSDKSEKSERGDRKSERGDRESERGDRESERGERDKSERGERDKSEKNEKDKRDPKYLAEKEKRRREKEKMEKQRERERTRERSEKRETREVKETRPEESVEIVQTIQNETTNVQNVQNNQNAENTSEKFMFVYEDGEGNLHSDLNKVVLVEGGSIKIFPVYFSGHNDNLYEEVVTYTNGVLTPNEENRENSWLNVIRSSDPDIEILPFDLEDVVVYNNRLFHCKDDLLDYLEAKGCEYLPVSK
jgi:hypothetical protein